MLNCLFSSSFVLMRSSLPVIHFKGKASCLPGDSEKLGLIRACTSRVNDAEMGIILTVHPKTALIFWDSRSSVRTGMFRNPRAQNSSVVLAHGCHGMLCAGRAGRDVIPCCCLGMLLMLSIVGLNEVLASFLKITCGHWTRPQGCGLLHPGLCVGHCVWCLVFGAGRSCILHACSQGMLRVVQVFQDPAGWSAAASAPSAAPPSSVS